MGSTNPNTHPLDCPDRKAAALDRQRHAAKMLRRQERGQVLAHAEWFGGRAINVRAPSGPSAVTPRAG